MPIKSCTSLHVKLLVFVISSNVQDKSCKEFEPEFKLEVFLDRVDEIEGEFDSKAVRRLSY